MITLTKENFKQDEPQEIQIEDGNGNFFETELRFYQNKVSNRPLQIIYLKAFSNLKINNTLHL